MPHDFTNPTVKLLHTHDTSFLRGGARPQGKEVATFIDANSDDVVVGRRLGVERICAVQQVAPSSYYEVRKQKPSSPAQRNEAMGPVVRALREDNYRVDRARRI